MDICFLNQGTLIDFRVLESSRYLGVSFLVFRLIASRSRWTSANTNQREPRRETVESACVSAYTPTFSIGTVHTRTIDGSTISREKSDESSSLGDIMPTLAFCGNFWVPWLCLWKDGSEWPRDPRLHGIELGEAPTTQDPKQCSDPT